MRRRPAEQAAGKTRPRCPIANCATAGLRREQTFVYTSRCACHPCAGALLIFSVSFQF